MRRLSIRLAVVLMTLALGSAHAENAVPKEATIPFANRGGVSDWQVVDDETVLLRDIHGKWYRAKLLTAATGLHFTDDLGFETLPSGALGKHGSLVVDGRRHPIVSLTRIERPAKR